MTQVASFGIILLTSSPSIVVSARVGVFSDGFGVDVPNVVKKQKSLAVKSCAIIELKDKTDVKFVVRLDFQTFLIAYETN